MKIETRLVTAEEKQSLRTGFEALNAEQGVPLYEAEAFGFVATENGRLCGAVYGDIKWGWLYIDILYVEAQCRDRDIGTKLMEKAEALAKERSLVGIHLFTQSWQASGFYGKLGFEEYSRLEDYPKGHTRLGFRKYLDR